MLLVSSRVELALGSARRAGECAQVLCWPGVQSLCRTTQGTSSLLRHLNIALDKLPEPVDAFLPIPCAPPRLAEESRIGISAGERVPLAFATDVNGTCAKFRATFRTIPASVGPARSSVWPGLTLCADRFGNGFCRLENATRFSLAQNSQPSGRILGWPRWHGDRRCDRFDDGFGVPRLVPSGQTRFAADLSNREIRQPI